MTDEQIVKINDLLQQVEAYRLNDRELRRLGYMSADPVTDEEFLYYSELILKTRAKTDSRVNDQITLLHDIAEANGISMDPVPEIIPEVKIPFVGGSL